VGARPDAADSRVRARCSKLAAVRQRLAGLIVLAVAAIVPVGAGLSSSAPEGDLLPDIRTFQPKDVRVAFEEGQKRIRFTTTFENAAVGAFELNSKAEDCNGNGDFEDDRTAYQRIFQDADGNGYFTRAKDTDSRLAYAGCLVYHPGHGHWHLDDFADYHLRKYRNGKLGPIVRSNTKIGFCHADEYHYRPKLPGSPNNRYFDPWNNGCDGNTPTGDSVGWGEDYESTRQGQHIDVTGLPDGKYCLVHHVDPRNRVAETNEKNNVRSIRITLQGNTVKYLPLRNC
jgi:hypothetical protein